MRVVDLGADSELGGKPAVTMVMLGCVLAKRMLRGKPAKKNSVQVSSERRKTKETKTVPSP